MQKMTITVQYANSIIMIKKDLNVTGWKLLVAKKWIHEDCVEIRDCLVCKK